MIFNIHGNNIEEKIDKFKSCEDYDTFITDAVHIYCWNHKPIRSFSNVWLIWRPGDPVEPARSGIANPYVRATETLFLDPNSLIGVPNIYIPYATTIQTFNNGWKSTSDHSADNLVYEQQCFSDTATIHVNSTLRAYMVQESAVWGNIINNVIADL